MLPVNRRKIAVGASLQTVRNVDVKAKSQGKAPLKFKLPNGLTVLLVESHKSPVVSVQMWVRTGSADEKKGEEGISHFIEHLVFKGTDKFGVGEIAAVVEGSGGELNAYTSFDQTVFYVTISKSFIETGLDVISQMMGFPKFDPPEINNEREVVIEEIKRGQDSLSRQSSQLLFSTNYQKHPYGIPVIGYDKVIRKVSPKVLVHYFNSRYVPQNMFLVVAGDFTRGEMKRQVQQYFGGMVKHRLRNVKRPKEPKQAKPVIKVEQAKFEESQFHIAWKIPGAKHKDIPALDVLALIFGQGESSRLVQRLRVQQALVNHVYSSSFTPHDTGLFAISAGINVDKFGDVLNILTEELGRLLIEPPSIEELQKAITNIESEEYYSQETVDGLARKAGSIEHLAGDYRFFEKYMKAVRSLKPADLVKVARTYLKPETLTFTMLTSGQAAREKKVIQAWLKSFKPAFAQAKKAKLSVKSNKNLKTRFKSLKGARTTDAQDVQKFVLPNGTKILMRPSYETPVVSVRTAFMGGGRWEPEAKLGLTELLSRTWAAGTQTRTEGDIQHTMDGLAGSLNAFGGRNTVGLSLDTLANFANEASELYFDVLTHATIPEDVVQRERVMMLEHLKTRNDNPAQIASLLFAEKMFKGHPYGRDMSGTPESIAQLGRQDTQKFLTSMLAGANCTVALSGHLDEVFWKESIQRATDQLQKAAKAPTKLTVEPLNESITIFRESEKQQSHIIHGYRGLTFSSPERFTLQLMQSILAGQGGRLFFELRDKASLAYSVAPVRMEGIEAGYFGAYIGCSPEKGTKAIAMMKTEFQKLAETLVPNDELERAKRYLIGRHDIDLQRNSSIASAILFDEVYGLDYREVFAFGDRIRAVTADQVRELAQKIFGQKSVTVAVGSQKPF